MDPSSLPPPLPPPPPSFPAPVAGNNWWGRNWKWFVPVGCLGVPLLLGAFLAFLLTIVFGAMRSSDAYHTAVARMEADPRAEEALGRPLQEGLFITGSIHTSGPGGHADLAIPVSGPKGEGTLYVNATKSAGEWHYSTVVLSVKATGEKIDLNSRPAGGSRAR